MDLNASSMSESLAIGLALEWKILRLFLFLCLRLILSELKLKFWPQNSSLSYQSKFKIIINLWNIQHYAYNRNKIFMRLKL